MARLPDPQPASSAARRPAGRRRGWAGCGLIFGQLLLLASVQAGRPAAPAWEPDRPMRDIAALVALGPRAPGRPGHDQAIQYIAGELRRAGVDTLELQSWDEPGPAGPRRLTNLIARQRPGQARRIILATHYDSIVRAYADPAAPDRPMPGANNGASGVALLLETARALARGAPPAVGIDFVFFDGEEGPLALGEGDPHWRALGSPRFAAHLGEFYPGCELRTRAPHGCGLSLPID